MEVADEGLTPIDASRYRQRIRLRDANNRPPSRPSARPPANRTRTRAYLSTGQSSGRVRPHEPQKRIEPACRRARATPTTPDRFAQSTRSTPPAPCSGCRRLASDQRSILYVPGALAQRLGG